MIELAVFDMAGTTVDEHGDVYTALENSVRETGVEVSPADLQEWMGVDKTEAIAALIELGGGEATPELVARTFDRFRKILTAAYDANPPVALPGVEDALRELKSRGIKVALTTGFSADVAGPLLQGLGWRIGDGELLDAVVTSDQVAAGRPAPYLIHRAMERTGVQDVRKVLAAGDTAVDLLAGVNAGVVAVGVLTGKLGRDEMARNPHSYILDGVKDVPALAEMQSA
ncbi:MAG TPA: phosphonatase-like hydrolase [Arthrobacter sp.]|nr:phosphonatase-like hydrolase [Arthrobacter sp.]